MNLLKLKLWMFGFLLKANKILRIVTTTMLKADIKIPTPFGFPIVLTSSFNFFIIIIFLLIGISSWPDAFAFLFIIMNVYICVILHEFGHIFCAKFLGYSTNNISIIPFGAMAHVKGDWHKIAKHELLIASSGPAVSFLLFAPSYFLMFGSDTFVFFYLINGVLFFFNLLPIIPFDGGRIVRALFHMWSKDFLDSMKLSLYSTNFASACLGLLFFYFGDYIAAMLVLIFGILFANLEYNYLMESHEIDNLLKNIDKHREELADLFEDIKTVANESKVNS